MARLSRLPWQAEDFAALRALQARSVHAVLLHGAAGIGKKVLALDYAQARLCESPRNDGHACGQCPACGWFAAGAHPDLRVVVPDVMARWRLTGEDEADNADEEGEGGGAVVPPAEPDPDAARSARASREIRIDAVRRLARFLTTSTHRGGLRVVVLAPAERITIEAANALLKMLEEPPAATLFVLATDAIDDVLPTVRSRCLLVRCRAPDRTAVLAWLRSGGVVKPEAALAEAGGSPLAAWLAAQDVDEDAETPTRLDAELRRTLVALLAQGPTLSAAEVAGQLGKTVPAEAAISLFQRWAWDLLALMAGGDVRYHPDHSQALARLARVASAPVILAWVDQLNRLQATRDHPLNARLVVESALLGYAGVLRAAPAGALDR
jgi:DNA polymerase-3 subunit delta'